jgi:hypothetical protein
MISVEQITSTLTNQHHQIKTMMETVVAHDGAGTGDRIRRALPLPCRT